MYRREDQYRSALEQARAVRRARRRRVYRRRRWLAVLTLVAVALLAVNLWSGTSPLAPLSGDEIASRETPTASSGRVTPPERTVLSVERRSAGSGTSGNDSSGKNEEKSDEDPLPQASEEPLNVLILGVDRRPGAGEGSSSRSDTMMLAQVTPKTGRVELLSVPRDLLVEVEPGVEDRINTAYAYGGVEQAKAVMEGVTGVPIDSHAIIDFAGFREVIDAIGGVRVDVGSGQFPEKWHMGEGTEKLNGRKALFYARYRGTARGDLDRIVRQQKMLAALRGEILSWNTVTTLPSVLKIANDHVDTDLGLFQAISVGRALAARGDKGDLDTVQLKGNPETLSSGAQVLVPDHEANEAILADFRE